MTNRQIVTLQCKCLAHERDATTPQARKYWGAQFRRLTALARKIGWID